MIPVLFPLFLLSSALPVLVLLRVSGCRLLHGGEEFFFAAAGGFGWMSFGAVVLGLFGLAPFSPLVAAAAVLLPAAVGAHAASAAAESAVFRARRGPWRSWGDRSGWS